MRGRPIYFSKGQLFIFWAGIFTFLAITTIGAFAADPNLQIDPTAAQPPLCQWVTFRSDRQQWGSSHQDMCYQFSGRVLTTVGSTPVHMYGGVPYSGYRPSYCYLNQDFLTPVPLGSRGSAICPPLSQAVQFSASEEKISDGGKFTINWSAWTAKSCTLSGKAPETGNFLENFNGASSPIYGTRSYDYVKRGVYSFQFKCNGYVDNSKSTASGDITRNLIIFVGNIPPAPTVDLKVEPDNIKIGESATLSWKTENAVAVSINQGVGVVAREGSIKVSPKFTTRYTITAAGEFADLGLARHSVSLKVVAAAKPGEIPVVIEAPPDEVVVIKTVVKPEVGLLINGQKNPLTVSAPANISISWKANQYCIAYGSWLGIKTKASTERRPLTNPGAYNYKLYCPGLGTEEVKVTVTGTGTGAVAMPAAEASISLNNKDFKKSIHVVRGQATHLWLGAGYDANGDGRISRDADGGWSGSMSNGGSCDWNYDLNQGVPVFDVAVGNPESAKDCTVDLGEVTFYDQPGVYSYGVLRLRQADGKFSSISSINIAVDAPPPPDTAPIINLSINGIKDRVLLGAPAVYSVNWNVINADTCSASDDWSGERFLSGTQQFVASTKRDLVYTLSCTGKLGTTTSSMFVKVAELPVCEFSALPTTLDKSSVFERESVLTWKCQFANTCSITPSTGVSTGTFGSVRVSPTDTTNYNLTCQNLDGSSSFDQVIELK